jgi:5-methylcytosine-specific restriction endonuclease McrA
VTVSVGFLRKLDAARDGLSHAIPGATTEQVLEAALDRLLERQARRRGQVKRPRQRANKSPSAASTAEAQSPATTDARRVPAEVRREIWARDQGRCQHPLDGGGICGSTVRLELHHVIPVALGGPPVAINLRLACSSHNKADAWEVLGGAVMASARDRQ